MGGGSSPDAQIAASGPLVTIRRVATRADTFHCQVCGAWVGYYRDPDAEHDIALHTAAALERIAAALEVDPDA